MNIKNKKFGLIGNPLGHSFSPEIHKALYGADYKLYPLPENEVENFIKKRYFDGINITIPYKETVMPFCDRISKEALEVGSVNTIVKENDGSLSAYNTDVFGFENMLLRFGIDPESKKVLILGSGGSCKTAKYVLKNMGAKEITVISRKGENNYKNINLHFDADIIINTTPVGMYPNNNISPINLENFKKLSGVCDLIYNPEKTALLLQAEKLGIRTAKGLYMLVAQAAKAAEFFTKSSFGFDVIDKVHDKINFDLRNIILIGMPSSGKSTVGKILARKLNHSFLDSDEEFTKSFGFTPKDVILNKGEKVFREKEHEILKNITKLSGKIIATGGGCVTFEPNFDLLKQNGKIVFINRDISLLESSNRPLSSGAGAIEALYKERLPLYKSICDYEISSEKGENSEIIAEKIINAVKA